MFEAQRQEGSVVSRSALDADGFARPPARTLLALNYEVGAEHKHGCGGLGHEILDVWERR